MTEQQENIDRVSKRIGGAILGFCKDRVEPFHMDELREHVVATIGTVAPASTDRILRNMRRYRQLNYKVLNRKQSLYQVVR